MGNTESIQRGKGAREKWPKDRLYESYLDDYYDLVPTASLKSLKFPGILETRAIRVCGVGLSIFFGIKLTPDNMLFLSKFATNPSPSAIRPGTDDGKHGFGVSQSLAAAMLHRSALGSNGTGHADNLVGAKQAQFGTHSSCVESGDEVPFISSAPETAPLSKNHRNFSFSPLC